MLRVMRGCCSSRVTDGMRQPHTDVRGFINRRRRYRHERRALESGIRQTGICCRQERVLPISRRDDKSAVARNPESNCNGSFKLKEPGRATTTTPKRLRNTNWDLGLALKTEQYSPRFHEEAQAFLFVTFSEQAPAHPWNNTLEVDVRCKQPRQTPPRSGTYNGRKWPEDGRANQSKRSRTKLPKSPPSHASG